MKHKGRLLKIIFFGILFLIAAIYIIQNMRNLHKYHDILLPNSDIPSDYMAFLNPKDSLDVKLRLNYSSKYRYPVCVLDYKNRYRLIIYKIQDSFEFPLTGKIKINTQKPFEKTEGIYNIVDESNFRLYISGDTSKNYNQIDLNLSGDSISILSNSDSLLLYYLKFNHISWLNAFNKYVDVYIQPTYSLPLSKNMPASLAFIKRNNSLYFIFLTVSDSTEYFKEDLMLSLISTK